MSNCTICGKPIILSPSAAERVRKYGGNAGDYAKLFTEHSKCTLDKRSTDVKALMSRKRKDNAAATE